VDNEVPHRDRENPALMRQMASHALQLARTVPGDEAGDRLNEYAKELEARAKALEKNWRAYPVALFTRRSARDPPHRAAADVLDAVSSSTLALARGEDRTHSAADALAIAARD
jgi:hypothetical protein